jgi:hypothetical protein
MEGSGMKANVKTAREAYSAGNRTAALLILSDVMKYGGEQAALVQWARAIVGKGSA